MGEKMRLDRLLAECGEGTRSEVKTYIKKGRVSVNGAVVKDNGLKVDLAEDEVIFGGHRVVYEKFRYFMLNKPQGCVSATRDGLSATVLDLLNGEITRDLFPVGRLDKDTEGFLLITNDGQLGHELLSPRKHVDKCYIACVTKALEPAQIEKFRQGVDVGDDKLTMPAGIELVTGAAATPYEVAAAAAGIIRCSGATEKYGESMAGFQETYKVTLQEGRYHQVKRMFEAFGSKVVYLKRISMGDVCLDESLAPGEYRRLTEDEVEALRR